MKKLGNFRQFTTSEKTKIIAGKNQEQNEELVKKYIGKNNLILHTAKPGSPFCIIKKLKPSISKKGVGDKGAKPVPELATLATGDSSITQLKDSSVVKLTGGKARIHYFFLGDFLEAVMDIIYRRPQEYKSNLTDGQNHNPNKKIIKENLKILLTALTYNNPITGSEQLIQLADVPISLNYFNSWFDEHVVSKKLSHYTLKQLLVDFCSSLLINVFAPKRYGPQIKFKQLIPVVQSIWINRSSSLSKYWYDNLDQIKERIPLQTLVNGNLYNPKINNANANSADNSQAQVASSVGKSAHQSNSRNIDEWFYFYLKGLDSSGLAATDRKEGERSNYNREQNIPHYYIGSQTDILKEVSFKKTQIPYHMQQALEEEGTKVRTNLLFQDIYNATVKLFGNPVFKPGMLLYIDPKGLGLGPNVPGYRNSSKAFRMNMGIGGYYRIYRVINHIEDGEFSTELQTILELSLRDIYRIRDREK